MPQAAEKYDSVVKLEGKFAGDSYYAAEHLKFPRDHHGAIIINEKRGAKSNIQLQPDNAPAKFDRLYIDMDMLPANAEFTTRRIAYANGVDDLIIDIHVPSANSTQSIIIKNQFNSKNNPDANGIGLESIIFRDTEKTSAAPRLWTQEVGLNATIHGNDGLIKSYGQKANFRYAKTAIEEAIVNSGGKLAPQNTETSSTEKEVPGFVRLAQQAFSTEQQGLSKSELAPTNKVKQIG